MSIGRLKGCYLRRVEGLREGSGEVLFMAFDGSVIKMHHHQDCCESVEIAEVIGDPDDLVNALIVEAEEVSSQPGWKDPEKDDYGSHTWTFYKVGSTKGSVTIRWLGTSNGYYSESVDVEELRGVV